MALHRFRERALSLILRSQPSLQALHAPPIFSLDRLLCSAATTKSSVSSPPSFAAEDYLFSRCGLTRAQAVKASKRISNFVSPSQPDAVLAFLGGTLGVPAADVAGLIALAPSFLSIDVERILAPRIADLSDLGLSRDEITRVITLAPNSFRSRFLRRNLEFWLKELGSVDSLLLALRMNSSLLCADLDKVVEPNVAFLRQCGINVSEADTVNIYYNRLFTMNPKVLKEAAERVEEVGVKRGSRMFPRALVVISLMSKESFTRRIQHLQKFGFTQDDVLEIMKKLPGILGLSHQKLQQNLDFLIKDVALDLSYIVQRPALLGYSVERRLLPRYCLLKVLREKKLLNTEFSYYSTASMGEKNFLQKFVLPYKDVIPGLVDGYVSKCYGRRRTELLFKKSEVDMLEK